MTSSHSDPFERFAAQLGLRIATEELLPAPRDLLEPPSDMDRCVLVSLFGPRADVAPLHTLFVTEPTGALPSLRDVLWWLSADSWSVEQVDKQFVRWAELYDYAEDDPAARRLFDLHVRQAANLATVLGDVAYRNLLEVYEGQLEGSA